MTAREQSRAGPKGLALRTLDGSLAVAIISLLGEGVNHQPDPEGTFLLPPVGDIFIALQHGLRTAFGNKGEQRDGQSGQSGSGNRAIGVRKL